MKKLTLSLLISAICAAPAMAAFDGHMSDHKDDIDKISSSFASLDNNDDGFISQEEADDDDIWEHFQMIDGMGNGNKDGKLSMEEFNAYISEHTTKVANKDVIDGMSKGASAKMMNAADGMKTEMQGDIDKISSSFASLDNNEDGFISKEEADDDDIWEHFGTIDGMSNGNKDGRVSHTEFNDYISKHKDKVANKDVIKGMSKPAKATTPSHSYSGGNMKSDDNMKNGASMSGAGNMNNSGNMMNSFDEIDTNQDGSISKSEYETHMTSSMGEHHNSGAMSKMNQNSDSMSGMNHSSGSMSGMKHNSGSMSGMQNKTDVMPGMSSAMTADKVEISSDSFGKLDMNKDGYLTHSEIMNTAGEDHFDKMDKNGDKRVSKREFKRFFKDMKTKTLKS